MNMDPMDDDVRHELDRDAGAISDVDIDATAIDCLEAVHYQLFFQGDDHVPLEDDPERLVLDHGVTECPGSRVHRVIVARVAHDVVTTVSPSDCVAAESD
uniref:Uncharacterized protein n=1 Tax=Noccaea caerulescens TaxID=107243 RepID=A0A1J3K5H8_NOCCA